MAKFLELKSEIKFAREYYNRNFVGHYKLQTQCDDIFEHIENFLKVIEDRIEIAEARAAEAPAPEARYWKDILNEYGVIYNLERMYNENQQEQPDKCRFFEDAECLYPIDDCINCPNHRNDFEWGGEGD